MLKNGRLILDKLRKSKGFLAQLHSTQSDIWKGWVSYDDAPLKVRWLDMAVIVSSTTDSTKFLLRNQIVN